MKKKEIKVPKDRLRNIGIMAHIDAGKTTLTERILFYTGKTYKIGDIDDGTTVMDWMRQERERGITITSAATSCLWKINNTEYHINIIDTPGHVDFTIEVERSLRVLDGSITVLDAVMGVEPQSETVWRQASRYHIPRLIFVNKMDRLGADFYAAIESVEKKLHAKAVPLCIPIGQESEFKGCIDLITMKALIWDNEEDLGMSYEVLDLTEQQRKQALPYREKLIEAVCECDDPLMEKYMEGDEFSENELREGIRKATLLTRIFPTFCGAALRNKGVQPILDAIAYYLPSPEDLPPIKGLHPKTEKEEIRNLTVEENLCGFAFKIQNDPVVGYITFFRLYSGELKAGSAVFNTRLEKTERIAKILQMHADKRVEVPKMEAGDIGAIIGFRETRTGDTFTDKKHPILLENIDIPEPVITSTVEPETQSDYPKLEEALNRIMYEDPTIIVKEDEETGQTVISGMGELHLDIIKTRLLEDFKVNIRMGTPQVVYRETITSDCSIKKTYTHPGTGKVGIVELAFAPMERGKGNTIVIEQEKSKSSLILFEEIERGIKDSLTIGVLAGYPVVDVLVELKGMEIDESGVDPQVYRIAAYQAVKEGLEKANSILLEPIMAVEVSVPEDYLSEVIGDVNQRRGKLVEILDRPAYKIVDSEIPLAEMFGYSTEIRSKTQGRASYHMQFSHYLEVPANIQKEILKY